MVKLPDPPTTGEEIGRRGGMGGDRREGDGMSAGEEGREEKGEER